MATNKIGVGIVTCNREEMFKKCVNSIPDSIENLVVVNDATPYSQSSYPAKVNKLIQNQIHKPVGVSKNILLRYFLEGSFDHIFLLEDDIYIIDPQVFEKYIKAAETTGVLHLNYGYHGPGNKDPNGLPRPRHIVDYGKDIKIALNLNVVGAFSYYHRIVIEKAGYMDERFNNAWEHVEHTERIAREGYHPPFWWFADVYKSYELIGEQDPLLAQSVISRNKLLNIMSIIKGNAICKESLGCTPCEIPNVSYDIVMLKLKEIFERKSSPS